MSVILPKPDELFLSFSMGFVRNGECYSVLPKPDDRNVFLTSLLWV